MKDEGIDVLREMKDFARREVVWQNGDVAAEFTADIGGVNVFRLDADEDTVLLMIDGDEGLMVDMVPNITAVYNTKARDMAWQFHLRRMMLAQMQNRIISPTTLPQQQPAFSPGGVLNFPGSNR